MSKWAKEFPQEEGWYWFYGDPFIPECHRDRYKFKLYMVRARKISNGMMYVANGNFFENRLNWGYWQKTDAPEVCNLDISHPE